MLRPKIAVLVPAHNEAPGIAATLASLRPQLAATDRLVVIADNCTDETAAIARQLGTTVIERQNADLRGKGYALDFGLKFLEASPPDVVVCVDADCTVHPGSLDRIARRAVATNRPVQSIYLMEKPENPGFNDMLSALAVRVKNWVRPLGLEGMGLPCLLTGSGMAFPWSVIRQISLASSATADDMQSALDLAIAGYPPTFCPEAHITGRLMQEQAAKSQRKRWEHGHLELILTRVPDLIVRSVSQKRLDLLAIALDLCVPPLSLLAIFWALATIVAFLIGILGGSWSPAIGLGVAGSGMGMSVLVAWAKFGQTDLPLLQLLSVPLYILWKVPLYLAFLLQPQAKWTRTERDAV